MCIKKKKKKTPTAKMFQRLKSDEQIFLLNNIFSKMSASNNYLCNNFYKY